MDMQDLQRGVDGEGRINPSNSPSSASSSPSHDFSFTISFHSPNKTEPPPSIDLSPADDIFFHGHLLPLHLLSQFPISPRSSTNSLLDSEKRTNSHHPETQERRKPKSFSIFELGKWRKGRKVRDSETDNEKQSKKRLRFEEVLKRYVRLMRPLFSSNLSKHDLEGRRRGEYSAPVPMTTSTRNNGHLVATANVSSSVRDSTMEELQAAIQAAIAHCKNS